jgi:hypothetical protein
METMTQEDRDYEAAYLYWQQEQSYYLDAMRQFDEETREMDQRAYEEWLREST